MNFKCQQQPELFVYPLVLSRHCPQMPTVHWLCLQLMMFQPTWWVVFKLGAAVPRRGNEETYLTSEWFGLFSLEPVNMADSEADEPSSRSESPEPEGRSSEDRSLLHQKLAIRELIDTEFSYLHMLRLCTSDIRSRLQQVLMQTLPPVFIGAGVAASKISIIPGRDCWKGPLVGRSLASLDISPRTLFIVHAAFSKPLNDLYMSNL